jgi:hypothetical protein
MNNLHNMCHKQMNKKNKTRFYIVSLIILPVTFMVSFFITIKIFDYFNFIIDYKGKIFICIGLAILYIRCLQILKNKFNELRDEPQANS